MTYPLAYQGQPKITHHMYVKFLYYYLNVTNFGGSLFDSAILLFHSLRLVSLVLPLYHLAAILKTLNDFDNTDLYYNTDCQPLCFMENLQNPKTPMVYDHCLPKKAG